MLGLPYAYVPLKVSMHSLHIAIGRVTGAFFFRRKRYNTILNARVPPYCDVLSPLSTITGAVNTLYFRENLLYGATTDVEDFSGPYHGWATIRRKAGSLSSETAGLRVLWPCHLRLNGASKALRL